MKKALLFLALTFLVTDFASAQGTGLRVGIKAGINMDKINGESFSQAFNFNYYAGAFVNVGLSKSFAIQPELLFSQSSSTTTSNFKSTYSQFFSDTSAAGSQRSAKLNYLSIPLLASISLGKHLAIQLGPQYSILLDQSKTLLDNGKAAFTNGDFALVGGIWIRLPLHLNLSGRYIIGLSNVNGLGDQHQWKTQTIQIGI
ncbi:MAG: porin family protein, partial [Chitinophagaceae bacterium]